MPFLIAVAPELAPSDIPVEPASEDVLITCEFRAEPLRVVLGYIAQAARQAIWVAPDIEECITVKMSNTPWREAVDSACDLANCVTRQEGNTIVVELPPRVTMEFKGADLQEVIRLLAKQAGANIVVDADLKGEERMCFSDIPCLKALNAVVKSAGTLPEGANDSRSTCSRDSKRIVDRGSFGEGL